MARELLYIDRIQLPGQSSYDPNESQEDFTIAFRDLLRSKLAGLNFVVGDVFVWSGYSAQRGMAFIVYHTDGSGVNTGPAWMFSPVMNDESSNAPDFRHAWGNQNSTTIGNYFLDSYNYSAGDLDYEDGWVIHYHPTGGTDELYGAGYETDGNGYPTGVLTGGDKSAPSVSPYADLAGFMPGATSGDTLHGICFSQSLAYGNNWSHGSMSIVADDSKPFLAVYFSRGFDRDRVHEIALAGHLFKPYEPTDVENHGFFSCVFHESEPWRHGMRFIRDRHAGFYETGARTTFSRDVHGYFEPGNSPVDSGEYPSDEVGVYNSSKYKGWYDPAICRVMGWDSDQYGALFSGPDGAFIKLDEYMVFPWVDNVDSPYGGFINSAPVVLS